MENPLLLTSLAELLQMNKEYIGIHLDEEYIKKVNDIPEIMFLEIEYKGLQRVVLILQQEIGETKIRQIEDKLRKTEVGKNGIEFDFLSILGVDYLKEIRKQVIKGYPGGWHTYMMYLYEEPKIGIKVILNVNEKDKLIEKEHVKLVKIKDLFDKDVIVNKKDFFRELEQTKQEGNNCVEMEDFTGQKVYIQIPSSNLNTKKSKLPKRLYYIRLARIEINEISNYYTNTGEPL